MVKSEALRAAYIARGLDYKRQFEQALRDGEKVKATFKYYRARWSFMAARLHR